MSQSEQQSAQGPRCRRWNVPPFGVLGPRILVVVNQDSAAVVQMLNDTVFVAVDLALRQRFADAAVTLAVAGDVLRRAEAERLAASAT